MAINLIIKYTLIEAFKRRLWASFLFVIMASLSLGLYAKNLSIIEGDAALLGFYAAFIRVGSVFVIGLYLIISECKTFEDARIQLMLALPISRSDLVLGKLCAYFIICLVMASISILPALFYTSVMSALIWGLSLYCELLILSSVACLLILIFKSSLFAILIYSIFYLFSRSAAEFYVHSLNALAMEPDKWLPWVLKMITYIVPKLDRFANSSWLIYKIENISILYNVLLQTLVFTTLLIILSLQKIRHKEF